MPARPRSFILSANTPSWCKISHHIYFLFFSLGVLLPIPSFCIVTRCTEYICFTENVVFVLPGFLVRIQGRT